MTFIHIPTAVYYYFAVKLRDEAFGKKFMHNVVISYDEGDKTYIMRGNFVCYRRNGKIDEIVSTWFDIECYVNGEQFPNDANFGQIKEIIHAHKL